MSRLDKIKKLAYEREISLTEKPLKAIFYGRVSTKNDSQKDSCDNQYEMALNYIKRHPNIEIIEKLEDEGLSGKNARTREDFLKLISLLSSGEVDLLITKSTSRLQRDKEIAAFIERLCRENEVGLLLLEDEKVLDFEDENTSTMYGIQSIFDAQYVMRQSKYGRMTHKLRCERKELSSKDICFGYYWDPKTKSISINEEEREIVEYIFNAYLFEQKNPNDIANELVSSGAANRFSTITNRGKFTFTSGTIRKIITNEKYTGRFYINKRTTKLGTGFDGKSKRINLPKEEWVLVDRQDLRIIDEDTFQLAQRLRASRQTKYTKGEKTLSRKSFEGTYLFAGKIRCGCCGKPLQHRFSGRNQTIPVYRVSNHNNCKNENSRIEEDVVANMVTSSIKEMLKSQDKAIKRVEDLLYGILQTNSNEDEIKQIKKNIAHFKKEVEKYSLPLTDPDVLSNKQLKDSFLAKVKEAQDNIALLEVKKQKLDVSMETSAIEERISHLRSAIEEFKEVKELSRERVLRNVKEIIFKEDGSVSIVLTSGLSFNSYVDKCELQDAPYS